MIFTEICKMIAIIDYNMGNPESVANMLKRTGYGSLITSKPEDISAADKLILPGVGAFAAGMDSLNKLGLIDLLNDKILKQKVPVLGICLGMQLLSEKSEEGIQCPGLSYVKAETIRFQFPPGGNLKIPHMGWNTVCVKKENPLFSDMTADARFYFVHSYHVACGDQSDILATTVHGVEFVSAIQRDNIFGVQFHPEKSHRFGMQLLKNFAEL